MIHVGAPLSYSQVQSAMISALKEIESNKQKIANPGPKDDVENVQVCVFQCCHFCEND